MPTYVYHCDACDTTFEATQRMSDPPLTECQCGEKGQVKRQLSTGAGVIFKGSGFYQTDYKGNGASPQSESKSESKPESKADSGGSCGAGCACHN
jgi:putative FmdB family regulatory protein